MTKKNNNKNTTQVTPMNPAKDSIYWKNSTSHNAMLTREPIIELLSALLVIKYRKSCTDFPKSS